MNLGYILEFRRRIRACDCWDVAYVYSRSKNDFLFIFKHIVMLSSVYFYPKNISLLSKEFITYQTCVTHISQCSNPT